MRTRCVQVYEDQVFEDQVYEDQVYEDQKYEDQVYERSRWVQVYRWGMCVTLWSVVGHDGDGLSGVLQGSGRLLVSGTAQVHTVHLETVCVLQCVL